MSRNSPFGIHAQQTGTTWTHLLLDGLGSARTTTNTSGTLSASVTYSPYGVPDAPLNATPFAFTDELRDGVGWQYQRLSSWQTR